MNDATRPIPGPDPGACPYCGGWRKAGMRHDCEEHRAYAMREIARDAQAALVVLAEALQTRTADERLTNALRRAIVYVKNMEMPDTGVIGPGGEREHDYHRALLHDEIQEWEAALAVVSSAAPDKADRG